MDSYIKLKWSFDEYVKRFRADVCYEAIENLNIALHDESIIDIIDKQEYKRFFNELFYLYKWKYTDKSIVMLTINLATLLLAEEDNSFLDKLVDEETKEPYVPSFLFDNCDFISEIRLSERTAELGTSCFSDMDLDKLIIPSRLRWVDTDSLTPSSGKIKQIEFTKMTRHEFLDLIADLGLELVDVIGNFTGKLTFKQS